MVLPAEKRGAGKIVRRGDLVVVVYDSADLDEELLESIEEYLKGRVVPLEEAAGKAGRGRAPGREG